METSLLKVNDKILIAAETGFLIGQYMGKSTHGGVLIVKVGMCLHNVTRVIDDDLTEKQQKTVHFFEKEYDIKPVLCEI